MVWVLADEELCGEISEIIFDCGHHSFTGLDGALLNTAQPFNLPAFNELEITIDYCGIILFRENH